VIIANLMFSLPAVSVSSHVRSSPGLWLGEVVATFGLLLVIFGVVRSGRSAAEAGSVSVAKRRVLFLCTHNSARSQMAEGLLRHFGGDRFDVFSAGTEATVVRPLAIRAMRELGIDISGQASKTVQRYLNQSFDQVITVCDQANEACPVFFGARQRLHWSFPDPSQATGTADEQLAVYREVRDSIRERIERELLSTASSPA
jgi:arsenate reductase (thioredoxin)